MPGPKIAACLIVKDEALTIERCLASLRPFVDEVNVYDTGSTDGTVELLERLSRDGGLAPVRVERGEWREDFAWARTRSFSLASPDAEWLVWADADDEIEHGAALRAVAMEASDVDVVVCAYDDGVDEHGRPRIRSWRERLVRARAGLVWQGVVHEHLAVPAGERRRARRIEPERLRWIHRPVAEPDPGRNVRLLRAAAERAPAEAADPRTLFYLGLESFWYGDFAAAEPLLRSWLARFGGDCTGDDAQTATNRVAACARVAGRLDEAVELERAAFGRRADWLPTAVGLTQSYAAAGDWAEVVEWARVALALEPPHSGVSIPYLEALLVPRLHLAEAKLELGRAEDAKDAFADAAAAAPSSPFLVAQRRRFDELVEAGALRDALKHVRSTNAVFDETRRAALRSLTAR